MFPDMARYSTSRPDTQETAAYAASQPLFDVLRGAISRLDEQKLRLNDAKTTVQHIHVKVPQEHVENNGTLPADYKDSLIAAWKSTTESYVRIFEQLCELTGPDPAAGKEAEESYVGFQKLLYTAEAARTVAFERHAEIKRKADSLSDDDSSVESTASPKKRVKYTTTAEIESVKRTADSEPSPSQNTQRPVKRQRTTEAEGADNAAEKDINSKPVNTVQRLKPKQIRRERKRRNQQNNQQQQQPTSHSATTTIPEPQTADINNNNIPQVQYEDISAELDARLRLKEEQKKSKKGAKKRKRESQGSMVLEAEPGAEREAMEARDKALAQKPAKKKSKGGNGEAVRSDGGEKTALAKGKRANDEGNAQGAPDEGTGTRRSKRKRTK